LSSLRRAAAAALAGLLLATASPLPVPATLAFETSSSGQQQQQQQQQQQRPRLCPSSAGDLAEAPSPSSSSPSAAISVNNDPPEESEYRDPFTLYGTSFKQFVIEQLDGEKIVARKRGFTVDSCVATVDAREETPGVVGLPVGEKVRTSPTTVCRRGTGSDLLPTCAGACQSSCAKAIEAQAAMGLERTGLRLGGRDARSLLRRCARDCTQECQKSGKAHDWSVPFRP
jgi:hypothetical protein